ncbi:S8 family serine peptidase [Micromonospora sp. CPCC 205371]|nr:S8 family serine peptidase [Micromonospora sp. CPCC 205371]
MLHKSCGADGHVRVIPGTVAGLVGSVLDEALFDVTTLIREGYDDARSKELPLIVKPADGRARSAFVTGLIGQRELRSIGAVAGKQPKGKPMTALADPAAAGKVWLDHRVHATQAKLDRNLRQVSAPQAWAAGYTGRGARVAVLDTGVDATHPDIAGRVAEAADFTGSSPEAVDGHGHGTHVAATVAGSGAAAGGERRGVAPDARLVVGKVLDDLGLGTDSQIIAGLEWAAPRADVVNLSLGGYEPSDGTDPLSQAVDAVSEQHGTLVVAASGNDPLDRLISTPAAAASALTVGAVDGADRLAEFSGRGPVINSNALKPEIVAPGVEIVAARAAGTGIGRIIDERYTALSGTSMAAPHVAGVAALLVQQHPDWDARRLKAALVGSADRLEGADAYTVGSGRLDAARALGALVPDQAVVNLGAGGAGTKPAWANTRARFAGMAASGTVAARVGAQAPDAATLSDRRLAIDAGGTGTTVLRIDRDGLATGFYTATVTARSGGRTVTTPIAFYVEPPTVELSMSMRPLPDAPAEADIFLFGQIVNLEDPALFAVTFYLNRGGEGFKARVPAGRYSITGSVYELGERERMALTGDSDITLATDTAFTLDATNARPVKVGVEGVETSPVAVGVYYEQRARRGFGWYDFAFAWEDNARAGGVYAVPLDEPGIGEFQAYTVAGMEAPGPSFYDVIKAHPSGLPADASHQVTAAERAKLVRIDQRFHRLDKPETVTGHKRYGVSASGRLVSESFTRDLSGDRVDHVSPEYRWIDEAIYDDLVTQEAPRSYPPGSRHEKVWVRQPLRPDWYDDPAETVGGCAPEPITRTRGHLYVELVPMTDQHQRGTCFELGLATTALYRNGALLGEVEGSVGDFAIPAERGTYRLVHEVDNSGWLPTSTRVSTAWTFKSAGPRGTGSAPVPLLSVDYELPLDIANRPAGREAAFTVHQAHGVARQRITSLALWTSVDDGVTWQKVPVSRDGADRFKAQLPQPAAGQAVSLRIAVKASGGSALDQTIVRAYQGETGGSGRQVEGAAG